VIDTIAATRGAGRASPRLSLPRADPTFVLASSGDRAISFFARRDLLDEQPGPVSDLWELREPQRIIRRQAPNGSWTYPGGKPSLRSPENYDQIETFRQLGILVEKYGCTREHPAIRRAAEFLLSFQTSEGDIRGIYGNQYATTYVGAITELLVKAGYAADPRIQKTFNWLLAMRQSDGGWAIPMRTLGYRYRDFLDIDRHPEPLAPDRSKPFSHLVTGMVLRAFAAHPDWSGAEEAGQAGDLLAMRLFKRDAYGDRGDATYWERVSFPFWFTDVVSALDTLSRFGLSARSAPIAVTLARLSELQRADGTFAFKLLRDKDKDLPWWICLAVYRSLRRWRLP
jgi:Squalene-hopene cyclase C-terminal domain